MGYGKGSDVSSGRQGDKLRLTRRDVLAYMAGTCLAVGVGEAGLVRAQCERSLEGIVRTVNGDVSARQLGITLIHEHLLLAREGWPRESVLDDVDLAARELLLFAEVSFKGPPSRTLVELTSRGLRGPAHAERLRAIAEKTGLHLVMSTGFHRSVWHPPDVRRRSAREIGDLLTADIREGVNGSAIRAGIIGEIGLSDPPPGTMALDSEEVKVLKACASAHRRTGAAVVLHFENDWRKPCRNSALRLRVLQYLRDEEGVDLCRVVVAHCSPSESDHALHRRIMEFGAYVAFDTWGADINCAAIPERDYGEYVRAIARLIEDPASLRKVLLSQDVCAPPQLTVNGGCGYAHVVRDVLPRLRALGVSDEQVRQLMVENPAAVLRLHQAG